MLCWKVVLEINTSVPKLTVGVKLSRCLQDGLGTSLLGWALYPGGFDSFWLRWGREIKACCAKDEIPCAVT